MANSLLLQQARESEFSKPALQLLGARLPEDGATLDQSLAEAVDDRDDRAFTHLLLAALHAGRPVDGRHLARGAALLPEPAVLAAATIHCSGEVAEALIEAVRRGHMGWEREAAALLLAAWWCREHRNGDEPSGLAARARALARQSAGSDLVQLLLLALSDLIDDAGLTALLKPYEFPGARALARDLKKSLIEPAKKSVLFPVPDRPEPLISGHTVRRAVARIGRNEPCPCGSGKKYKKCCYDRDQERLRHSSDVAGVTVDELRANPERYLDPERLWDMRSFELARLDYRKIDPALYPQLLNRLNIHNEFEAVLRFFEEVGFREELEGHLLDAVEFAADSSDVDMVHRLVEIRGEQWSEPWQPRLGVRLLTSADQAGPLLQEIEDEARKVLGEAKPYELVDFAHGLLSSPFPGLGVLIARGVLPLAFPLDASTLLDRLMEARDQLGLPFGDPIEDTLDTWFSGFAEEDTDAQELLEARGALDIKNVEIRQLRTEVTGLRQRLNQQEQRVAAAEPQAPTRQRGNEPPLASPGSEAIRQRLGSLKQELTQRHRERNQLRRELLKVKEDLEALRQAKAKPSSEPSGEDAEDRLLHPEEVLEAQPVRIPSFPQKFTENLNRVPENVARATVRLVGALAAGDRSAFQGVKRLSTRRDIWRQRVGHSYRLLFRVDDRSLEVIDLVNRKDLERAIKGLG